MTHTRQLLLVTFCCTTAGIEVSFRKHGRTADGRTDRRGSRNSYLDMIHIVSTGSIELGVHPLTQNLTIFINSQEKNYIENRTKYDGPRIS